jgi:hypothetical protein
MVLLSTKLGVTPSPGPDIFYEQMEILKPENDEHNHRKSQP